MPLISHFYGVLIHIYTEKDGRHHTPHIHARYSGQNAVYDLEGECIEGKLPRRQHRTVVAWIDVHSDELKAAWEAWNETGDVIKIEGWK